MLRTSPGITRFLPAVLLSSLAALAIAQRSPEVAQRDGGEVVGVQSESRGTDSGNEIQEITDQHGSIQPVRGIQGIDAVMLQNLEAVIRVQTRPEEQEGKGTPQAAAALSFAPSDQPIQELPDARDQHQEFELEGS